MINPEVTVHVPATTANLGPGFDCLALALDLWNEITFRLEGADVKVEIEGEGKGCLPTASSNLIARTALDFYDRMGRPKPQGLKIHCKNNIPLSSGLGSSAAAVLAGLLGANALLSEPAGQVEILRLADEIEGHPDNVAAALVGGLVVVLGGENGLLVRRFEVPSIPVTVVLPEVDLPTKAARAVLPKTVPLEDAVFNIGRAALVVDALRSGNLDLLGQVMEDRLHQPYRLGLIPGGKRALLAARSAGAAAAALSGAGPSLAAFGGDPEKVCGSIEKVFNDEKVPCSSYRLKSINRGAWVG
jgi:homoserine kinase